MQAAKVAAIVRSKSKDDGKYPDSWVLTDSTIRVSEGPKGATAFSFDGVYPITVTTQQIYENHVVALVENVVDAYNSTVFAYGETSSGKSYTVVGSMAEKQKQHGTSVEGLVHFAARDLFKMIQLKQEATGLQISVKFSYIDIYNDSLRDLLTEEAREAPRIVDSKDSVTLLGAYEPYVTTFSEVEAFIHQGEQRRATTATKINNHSSRSHALLRLILEFATNAAPEPRRKPAREATRTSGLRSFGPKTSVPMATLTFADLAGSERQSMTQARGPHLKEAGSINNSLMTLGRVIGALASGTGFVPFRESKLTRMLQPCLGGNSFTLLIACVSLGKEHVEETLGTLRFASKCSMIKNKVSSCEPMLPLQPACESKCVSDQQDSEPPAARGPLQLPPRSPPVRLLRPPESLEPRGTDLSADSLISPLPATSPAFAQQTDEPPNKSFSSTEANNCMLDRSDSRSSLDVNAILSDNAGVQHENPSMRLSFAKPRTFHTVLSAPEDPTQDITLGLLLNNTLVNDILTPADGEQSSGECNTMDLNTLLCNANHILNSSAGGSAEGAEPETKRSAASCGREEHATAHQSPSSGQTDLTPATVNVLLQSIAVSMSKCLPDETAGHATVHRSVGTHADSSTRLVCNENVGTSIVELLLKSVALDTASLVTIPEKGASKATRFLLKSLHIDELDPPKDIDHVKYLLEVQLEHSRSIQTSTLLRETLLQSTVPFVELCRSVLAETKGYKVCILRVGDRDLLLYNSRTAVRYDGSMAATATLDSTLCYSGGRIQDGDSFATTLVDTLCSIRRSNPEEVCAELRETLAHISKHQLRVSSACTLSPSGRSAVDAATLRLTFGRQGNASTSLVSTRGPDDPTLSLDDLVTLQASHNSRFLVNIQLERAISMQTSACTAPSMLSAGVGASLSKAVCSIIQPAVDKYTFEGLALQVEDYRNRCGAYVRQNEDLLSRIDSLSKSMMSAKSALSRKEDEGRAELESALAQIKALLSQLKDAQAQISLMEDARGVYEDRLSRVEVDISGSFQRLLTRLEGALSMASCDAQGRWWQVCGLREELAVARHELSTLAASTVPLKKYTALEQSNHILESELRNLKRALGTSEEQSRALAASLEETLATGEGLRGQLASLSAERNAFSVRTQQMAATYKEHVDKLLGAAKAREERLLRSASQKVAKLLRYRTMVEQYSKQFAALGVQEKSAEAEDLNTLISEVIREQEARDAPGLQDLLDAAGDATADAAADPGR